jgi:hypothetical protein
MPEFLGSINAGNNVPVDVLTDTQGSILYHNGTGWVVLTPGTAGYRLKTNGAAANPEWVINTPESHTHGAITNAGAIGSTSGLPIKTGASGVLEVGAFGTGSGQFAAGDHKHTAIEINAQTGTSYTLVLGDAGKLVSMNNGSASTWTIPPNASVAFPTGTELAGVQLGAGGVTITPGSGVTLLDGGGGLVTSAANTSWGVVKIDTNTWLVVLGAIDAAVTLADMATGTAGNLITYDASGNPAAVATGTATHVLTSNGAGAAPTFQAIPSKVVNVWMAESTSTFTISTTAVVDDTAPQTSELTSVITKTITPSSTSNYLKFTVSCWWQLGSAGAALFAIFKDSDASATYVIPQNPPGSSYDQATCFVFYIQVASTSSQTWKFYAGGNGVTLYLNRRGSGALYSTTDKITLSIEEVVLT